MATDRLRGRKGVERRKRWLEDNPLCVECIKVDRTTAATVPDHIVALVNGGADDETNLQSLCADHHREKTARDLGHKAKRVIGPDGWPMEQNEPQGAKRQQPRRYGRGSDRSA